jgi:hypothetical protein
MFIREVFMQVYKREKTVVIIVIRHHAPIMKRVIIEKKSPRDENEKPNRMPTPVQCYLLREFEDDPPNKPESKSCTLSAIGSSPRSRTRLPDESKRGGKSTVSPESEALGDSERDRRWSFSRLRFRR